MPSFLPPKPHQLQPGTVLRGYEILGVIGQGGFGLSYLAIDKTLEREVVIKEYFPTTLAHRDHDGNTVIPTGDDSYLQGLEYFFQEAQALSQLQHPHIVDVRTVFRANDTAYLVMPYYQGQNLESWLDEKKAPLGERAAFELLRPVLEALEYIHGEQIIHRDVKPANILMAVRGTSEYPVLLDFGGARTFIADATQTFDQILSPGYAPFEQYSRRDQGPWTDVYACGAVLYRMVVGERPPDAMERKGGRPLALEGLSPEFAAVIEKAMAEAPGERLQGIAELKQAGEEALASGSAQQGRDDTPRPVPPDPNEPERRGLQPLPTLLFLALAAGGFWALFLRTPVRTASDVDALVRMVQQARSGAIIELEAGDYLLPETLEVTRTLTLRSAGEERARLTSQSAAPLVRFAPEDGGTLTIENVAFAYSGTGSADVLEVEGGRLEIVESQIEGAVGGRGLVARDAELSVIQSLLRGNDRGVELTGSSSGDIVASHLLENAIGLDVGGDSSVTVQESNISSNRTYGIAVREAGTLEAHGGTINTNGTGAFAEGGSSLTLRSITLERNRVGIHLVDTAGGMIEGSTVSGNSAGVVVQDSASPTIAGNQINGNDQWGICSAGGAIIQPDNAVEGNGLDVDVGGC